MNPSGRRSFLRGCLGASVGLPFLEVFERTASAQATAANRYFIGFASVSLGESKDYLVPDRVGSGYDIKTALEPLLPGLWRDGRFDVQSEVSVISGLRVPFAYLDDPATEPATRSQRFHMAQMGPLFSGTTSHRRGQFYLNDKGEEVPSIFRPLGPSSDQLVARQIGADRVFPALAYRVQPYGYFNGSLGTGGDRALMSHGDGGEQLPPIYSPQQAYTQLMGAFSSNDTATEAARADAVFRKRMSVLDLVRDQTRRLEQRASGEDRRRMDKHFTEIRSLEQRLESLQTFDVGACTPVTDPGADAVAQGQYADEEGRAIAFTDMIAMAFACGLTQSASMMYTAEQSRLNMKALTGYDLELHQHGHSGAVELQSSGLSYTDKIEKQMAAAQAWHVKHFARLVRKLKDMPDSDGQSVLDNSALMLLFEGGRGFDPDTNRAVSVHSNENMAFLFAGGAGGLRRGEHVRVNEVHATKAVISMMRAVGASPRLGEMEGYIPEMFA